MGARDEGVGRHPHWPRRPCLCAAGAREATFQREGRKHACMGGGDVGGGGERGRVRRRGFGTVSGMFGGEWIEAHQRVLGRIN